MRPRERSGSSLLRRRLHVLRGALPHDQSPAVRAFDEPDRLPPDMHIFTSSKQPWVVLLPGTPAVPEYYDRRAYWPAESLERWRALKR